MAPIDAAVMSRLRKKRLVWDLFLLLASGGGWWLTIPLGERGVFFLVLFLIIWGVGRWMLQQEVRQLHLYMAENEQRSVVQQKTESDLDYITHFDPLTGLPNRLLFSDRLRLALAHAERLEKSLAVAVLVVDHFHRINRAYGHSCGEKLLRQIAERIGTSLRSDDTVASLGDGRFYLIFPELRRGEDVSRIVQKLRQAFVPPFDIDGGELFVTTSLGFALSPEDGENEETLLKHADVALSRAKSGGSNRFALFAPSMNVRALELLTLENQLRMALERQEFELWYQPQVDARSGEIIGAEALLRWRNPELGLVSPVDFIPMAEESGLILPLGEWVLLNACRQAKLWQEAYGQTLQIAVNISPRQFLKPDLLETVDSILASTRLSPDCLELEITEGTIVHDVERAVSILAALKSRGIRIAIDDFGTGYSSLNYLKTFPVDRIKIDRSFISDIRHAGDDSIIISSIIAMAGKLGLEVLAEGVETDAQKDFLLANDACAMQGYLFSRPLDVRRLTLLLQALRQGDGDLFSWWKTVGGGSFDPKDGGSEKAVGALLAP